MPLGGLAWGSIPPLEDEINELLEKTNLKALSAALDSNSSAGARLPEATPPLAVARSTGTRAAGVRHEPSQPPPQFMKRGSSVGVSPTGGATASEESGW